MPGHHRDSVHRDFAQQSLEHKDFNRALLLETSHKARKECTCWSVSFISESLKAKLGLIKQFDLTLRMTEDGDALRRPVSVLLFWIDPLVGIFWRLLRFPRGNDLTIKIRLLTREEFKVTVQDTEMTENRKFLSHKQNRWILTNSRWLRAQCSKADPANSSTELNEKNVNKL